MAKIKLVVRATSEETFSNFIISKKANELAEKTLLSYHSQVQAVHDTWMSRHCHAPKGGFASFASYVNPLVYNVPL